MVELGGGVSLANSNPPNGLNIEGRT